MKRIVRNMLVVGLLAAAIASGTPPATAADEAQVAELNDPPVSGGHSDADLEVEVEKALILESGVTLTGIEVQVRNGVVTLSGTVNSEEARESAALAAVSAGALRVNNQLIVEPR